MNVQFSAKITNSLLVYVARRQWPRERVYELTDLPYEFLTDPSSWLDAQEVERFCARLSGELVLSDPHLLPEVGSTAHELRAWGVLDSVLKMMSSPADIYSQPQRFLSYFISPAPPIANLRRDLESVSFDLPISQSEFPFVGTYIASALAGLPKYLGREPAVVTWWSNTIEIRWSTQQIELIHQEREAMVPKPELVDRLVQDVEVAQARLETRELEVARLERALAESQDELKRLKARTSDQPVGSAERRLIADQLSLVRDLSSKMMDCMTRGHQALGIARAMLQKDNQFQAVLKRVDWDTLRTQYPWYHLQTVELIEGMQGRLVRGAKMSAPGANFELAGEASLAEVIAATVEKWRHENPGDIEFSVSSEGSKDVRVDRERLGLVLSRLLSRATNELDRAGRVDVRTEKSHGGFELKVTQYQKRSQRSKASDELPLFRQVSAPADFGSQDELAELLVPLGGQVSVKEITGSPKEWICKFTLQ